MAKNGSNRNVESQIAIEDSWTLILNGDKHQQKLHEERLAIDNRHFFATANYLLYVVDQHQIKKHVNHVLK